MHNYKNKKKKSRTSNLHGIEFENKKPHQSRNTDIQKPPSLSKRLRQKEPIERSLFGSKSTNKSAPSDEKRDDNDDFFLKKFTNLGISFEQNAPNKGGLINRDRKAEDVPLAYYISTPYRDKCGEGIERAIINQQIINCRPAVKVKEGSPNSHMPRRVQTPRGGNYIRRFNLGPCGLYAKEEVFSEPCYSPKREVEFPNTQGEIFRTLVSPPQKSKKGQSIRFTNKLQEEIAELHQVKRSTSQARTMSRQGKNYLNASASSLATALKLRRKTERWEWLHLIAYLLIDLKGQNSGNLVAGTAYANTWMMIVERMADRIRKYLGEFVSVNVSTNLIDKTHVATVIDYKISIDLPDGEKLELPFSFNAQTTVQPLKRERHIADIVVGQILHQTLMDLENKGYKLPPSNDVKNVRSCFKIPSAQTKISMKPSFFNDPNGDYVEQENQEIMEGRNQECDSVRSPYMLRNSGKRRRDVVFSELEDRATRKLESPKKKRKQNESEESSKLLM